MCVDEGLDESALLPSAIIILVISLFLLGIGKILIYAVIMKKSCFFVFRSVDDFNNCVVIQLQI